MKGSIVHRKAQGERGRAPLCTGRRRGRQEGLHYAQEGAGGDRKGSIVHRKAQGVRQGSIVHKKAQEERESTWRSSLA